MNTTVEGTYDNGLIIWDKIPPVHKRTKVVVTFLEQETEFSHKANSLVGNGIRFGSLSGKVGIPADFNDPIEDLDEYM